MGWYRAGTVAVTNGSKNVTGTDTLWVTVGLKVGDVFTLDGEKVYEVETITGEGTLTLKTAWTGSTLSAQAYGIITNLGTRTNAELAQQVADLLASWQTREDQMQDWIGGTSTGGPGSNGTYPLTDAVGTTANVKSPARMQADVDAIAASGNTTIASLESGAKTVNLVAVDKIVAQAADVVKVLIYDTSRDSDGGAWRLRCEHLSWENETLSGGWLGLAASEAAARALTGATTSSYYHNTTDGGFYKLNAGSGQTQVYRGSGRKFPALALLVGHSTKLVIYDLTDPAVPMWMVFVKSGSNNLLAGGALTSIAAMNGTLVIGMSDRMHEVRLLEDRGYQRLSASWYTSSNTLAARNSGAGWYNALISASGAIVNAAVNDVAMTVLPNAPVDATTGLPIPTIAVATNGGVSVIKHDGTVVNWLTTAGVIYKTRLAGDGGLFATGGAGVSWKSWYKSSLPTSSPDNTVTYTFDGASAPPRSGDNAGSGESTLSELAGRVKAVAVRAGTPTPADSLNLLMDNPATPAKGCVAYLTKAFNSGWLTGDIRAALLSDTTAETATRAELVTNGTFDTATTGWTANAATLSAVSGKMRVANSGAVIGGAYQTITFVAGKSYVVTADYTPGTDATGGRMAVQTADGASTIASSATLTASGQLQITFTATAAQHRIQVLNGPGAVNGQYSDFDNISCGIAVEDRSVKNKGALVYGSITKSAVVSGANLMGYSGFAAANLIEQSYNADLDFGTGDFSVMGWVNYSGTATAYPIDRANPGRTGARWSLILRSDINTMRFALYDGTTEVYADNTGWAEASGWRFFCFTRAGTTCTLYVDAVPGTAITNAYNLSNTTAKLRIGQTTDGVNAGFDGSLVLVRVAATAPSAEQIKYIYETERALFQANAQCTLGGTSNAVQTLAHDDAADRLVVGTADGTSILKGLQRVAYIDQAGTPNSDDIRSVSAQGGAYAIATTSEVVVNLPAKSLREEIERGGKRRAERRCETHWFTATTGQTAFALPLGWRPRRVSSAGTLKRETSDYTVGFDGFLYTITFTAAPGNGVSVAVEAEWRPQ